MREIQKSDVIGARIVDVHEAHKVTEGGMDCRQIYFTVERGFSFLLPIAGRRWPTSMIVPSAKQIGREFVSPSSADSIKRFLGLAVPIVPTQMTEIVRHITQRQIVGVYCGPFSEKLGFHYPDDGILVLDDGSQVSNTVVAPLGTGGAGLYLAKAGSAGCTPLDQLVDYFDISIDEENQ